MRTPLIHQPPATHPRPGYSLIEAVVALALSALLMAVISGICVAQMRLARAAAQQAETAEAVRTVAAVMGGEARRMTAGDVGAVGGDSIALRAFRGSAIVCGAGGPAISVRYRGDRLPDPAKDSLLVLLNGAESVVALFDAAPAAGACAAGPGEQLFTFDTSAPVPNGSVLLLFEHGSYHLRDRALRYRIGAGGRQPLTSESLQHPLTRFDGVTPDAIRFTIDAGGRMSTHAAAFSRRVLP